MGIEVGDKKVKKIMVGDKVIYQDSDGWIPLELPDSAIDGLVLFRDNGDDTASIAGSARYSIAQGKTILTPILIPPAGYEFTSVPWNTGTDGDAIIGFNGMTGGSIGTGQSFHSTISNGFVVLRGDVNKVYGNETIFFTQNTTNKAAANTDPATAFIKNV